MLGRASPPVAETRASHTGWDGGLYFSELVRTASGRKKFAKQLKVFADKYGFQGVDIGESFRPWCGGRVESVTATSF